MAFVFGLALVLAAAEGAMRIAAMIRGHSVTASKAASNDASEVDLGPALKIAILGESTSESWWYDEKDHSWSAKLATALQTHFRAHGIKRTVQTINLARSGASSTLLVDHLAEVLETMTPDIVITMMGINDSVALQIDRGFLYSNSFVARFLYWSYVSIRCPNCYRVSNEFVDDNPVAGRADEAFHLINQVHGLSYSTVGDLEKADAAFRQMKARLPPLDMASDPDRDKRMDIVWATWLYGRSEAPDLNQRDEASKDRQLELRAAFLRLADKYFEDARDVVVKRKGSIKQHCFVLNRLRKWPEPCLALVKGGLQAGVVLTPDFLALALSAGAANDPELKATFDSHGYSILKNQRGIAATVSSYRRLIALQKKFGFRWFAMQYPKGSVAGLSLLFDPQTNSDAPGRKLNGFSDLFNFSQAGTEGFGPLPEGVALVSNENFNTIVTPENEADYFRDMFARGAGSDFGHTTEKGHDLIAENVLRVMLKHIDFKDFR